MISLKKGKTENVSLRLSSDIVNLLKEDAEAERVSLNTLANQILNSYAEWDRTAVKAGWGVLQKDVLKEIMNELSEEAIIKIAIRTASYTKDIRLLMTGRDDLEGFIMILKGRVKRSGFYLQEPKQSDGRRKFVIQHDMGIKWSIFWKYHYEKLLNSLGYPASFEYTENTLVMIIKEK